MTQNDRNAADLEALKTLSLELTELQKSARQPKKKNKARFSARRLPHLFLLSGLLDRRADLRGFFKKEYPEAHHNMKDMEAGLLRLIADVRNVSKDSTPEQK